MSSRETETRNVKLTGSGTPPKAGSRSTGRLRALSLRPCAGTVTWPARTSQGRATSALSLSLLSAVGSRTAPLVSVIARRQVVALQPRCTSLGEAQQCASLVTDAAITVHPGEHAPASPGWTRTACTKWVDGLSLSLSLAPYRRLCRVPLLLVPFQDGLRGRKVRRRHFARDFSLACKNFWHNIFGSHITSLSRPCFAATARCFWQLSERVGITFSRPPVNFFQTTSNDSQCFCCCFVYSFCGLQFSVINKLRRKMWFRVMTN